MNHRDEKESSDCIWRAAPLRELIAHIIARHHAYLRAELPALEKLVGAIGKNLPGGAELSRLIACLNEDLELQMEKEETILFPAILELESAFREKRHIGYSKFGSVRNVAKVIGRSNSQTLKAAEEIRKLTNDYRPIREHDNSASNLFQRLAGLERDLHRHIHLENEILFYRAAELEGGIQ